MPSYVTDGLLWVSILAGTFYAYRTIPDTLNHVRNLAACPEPIGPGPQKQLQKDAENAIGIEALRVLSGSPSYELRAAIIKITATRVVNSRTKKLLLKDLASKSEKKRYDAICAIWMLLYNPALQGKSIAESFLDFDSFHAVVTALSNVLEDHKPNLPPRRSPTAQLLYPEPNIPPSPIKPRVRPYQEFSLLMILRVLLNTTRPYDQLLTYPDNMACALSAGLIERWLKFYPFPCALPENAKYNFKKVDISNLFEFRAWGNDDVLMASIINNINMTAMGKKHLRDAGLRGSNYTEIEDLENTMSDWKYVPTRIANFRADRDVRMTNGESTAGAITPPPVLNRRWTYSEGQPLQTRSQELSREEESLRRRRREAVVVADAGTPIGQANILQRTESGSAWQGGLEQGDLLVVQDLAVPTPPSPTSSSPPILPPLPPPPNRESTGGASVIDTPDALQGDNIGSLSSTRPVFATSITPSNEDQQESDTTITQHSDVFRMLLEDLNSADSLLTQLSESQRTMQNNDQPSNGRPIFDIDEGYHHAIRAIKSYLQHHNASHETPAANHRDENDAANIEHHENVNADTVQDLFHQYRTKIEDAIGSEGVTLLLQILHDHSRNVDDQ